MTTGVVTERPGYDLYRPMDDERARLAQNFARQILETTRPFLSKPVSELDVLERRLRLWAHGARAGEVVPARGRHRAQRPPRRGRRLRRRVRGHPQPRRRLPHRPGSLRSHHPRQRLRASAGSVARPGEHLHRAAARRRPLSADAQQALADRGPLPAAVAQLSAAAAWRIAICAGAAAARTTPTPVTLRATGG